MSQKIKKFNSASPTVGKKFNPHLKTDAWYNSDKWNSYRHKFLKHNPLCYSCGSRAEALDHLQPHKGNEELFWKMDNIIPLCHRCHNTVTSLFDRNYRAGTAITKKIEWLNASRQVNDISTKVKVVPF